MRIYLFIGITVLMKAKMLACSYDYCPSTFMENVSVNQIIFAAEIIEQIDTLKIAKKYLYYESFTKLKVIKWYQNKLEKDTIYYVNGQGALCQNTIAYYNVGSKLILKAHKKPILENQLYSLKEQAKDFLNKFKKEVLIGFHICGPSVLQIENDSISGNITRNYSNERSKIYRFKQKISKKWAAKYKARKIGERRIVQYFSFSKFERLMRQKWNSF